MGPVTTAVLDDTCGNLIQIAAHGLTAAPRRPRFRAMSAAISVSGLVKTFGPTRALDGLDLEVATGEVHGFLGPNGSGKSTTIRVLLGLLRADSGAVRLLDGDPWDDAVALHRRLAYVPGDVTLWPSITGGEAIDLLGRLRGGIDPAPAGRAARALRPRPDQEGPQLLEGQPAEGGARGRPGLRRRTADPRRADVGPRPAHGGGVPGVHPRGRATRAAPCCCRATSWPRPRRSATGSASSGTAARCRAAA